MCRADVEKILKQPGDDLLTEQVPAGKNREYTR